MEREERPATGKETSLTEISGPIVLNKKMNATDSSLPHFREVLELRIGHR